MSGYEGLQLVERQFPITILVDVLEPSPHGLGSFRLAEEAVPILIEILENARRVRAAAEVSSSPVWGALWRTRRM